MVSPVKRIWSQQGQTPVFRASLNHHERLNLFGVLLVSPKARKIYLSVKSYWDTLTGDKVITFLKQILHLVHRHIVLVWDRHPIHRRALVKEFIQTHKRLHVFEFPVAAPEHNPAEYIWTQTKEYTAGTAPHDNTNYKQMFLRALPAPALLRNVYWPVCETLKSTGSIN